MILQGKARTPVREVVLHCAAIKTGQFAHMNPFQMFATVNRWHIERGFKSFGYHGLITPDGVWYRGRPFEQVGAHVIGHNSGTLGFLLIESRQITHVGTFSDWFTPAQDKCLRLLLDDLAAKGVDRITGHNDHAKKLCPGFRVSEWFKPDPAKGDNFVTLNPSRP